MKEFVLIESKEDFEKHFEKILENPPKVIFFDCEGDHLSRTGKLCVLQIAFFENEKPNVYLFDALKYKEAIYLLKPLFESEKVLKVIHDTKRDAEALSWQFEVQIKNVFDTQVAYYEMQKNNKKINVNFISFVQLLQELCQIDYSKKNSLPHVEFQDSTHWLERPLAEFLIESAINDVIYLKPIFDYFQKELKEEVIKTIIKVSSLWAKSFYEHKDLATSSTKVTYIDIFSDPFLLRVIKCPCFEIMSMIIGKKGAKINELKEKYYDKCLIYSTGKDGPKDYLYLLCSDKDVANEIMTKIPTYVFDSLVTRYQTGKILSKIVKIQKDTQTMCIIFTGEFKEIDKEHYHKMLIMGDEKNVQKAIEMVNSL